MKINHNWMLPVFVLLLAAGCSSSSDNDTTEIDMPDGDEVSGDFIDVICEVADDGTFSFPAETQVSMGADFTTTSVDFTRQSVVLLQQGTAVLALTASSGASL